MLEAAAAVTRASITVILQRDHRSLRQLRILLGDDVAPENEALNHWVKKGMVPGYFAH